MLRCFHLFLAAALVASLAGDAAASTSVPGVRGPLPVTAGSYPFGAADHTRVPQDLRAIGYVEEEFLVAGTANVYDWPEPGPAVVRTAAVPYVTRVLVRRPRDRARFSGSVIVEMLNPSNLFDLNIGWAISSRQIVRHGDAWVGITSKPVSIATLKTFDPERYRSLAMPNPLPLDDPGNCATVASDSAQTTENGLAWDIYTQVGAWLRSRTRSNPLLYGSAAAAAAHPVQYVYAWGYSQTGSFLYTYVNAIHPLVVKEDGRSMFDAYLIGVASGPAPINQCAAPVPAGDPRRFVRNAGVPVVRVMSQSDYLSGIAARRPDSDAAPDLYRNYEVAGSAHATPDELNFAAAPADIEKGGRTVPPMACNEGPAAASRTGRPSTRSCETSTPGCAPARPPHAEPILVVDGKPVLDRFGNVIGGIRSPLVEAPTSTWFGNSTGPSFCRIAGHEVPMDRGVLKTIYPTPDEYVRAVTASVSRLVLEGFIVQEDGDELVAEARRTAQELVR